MAFFAIVVGLLVVPLAGAIASLGFWAKEDHGLVQRLMILAIGGAILLAAPPLRRWCRSELSRPLSGSCRGEIVAVALAKPFLTFGIIGAMALWYWAAEGPAGLAQRVRAFGTHDAHMAQALSTSGLITQFVLAMLLAPVIEELIFRGLLYRAWERDWGWLTAAILTSAVFGFYHSLFWPAFLSSLVFVCLYRRCGTLWAPIIVHFFSNLVVWYPLLGRWILPRDLDVPGDLSSWSFHLAALMVATVALPAYLWMSRDAKAAPDFYRDAEHEPVPQ